MSSEKGLRTVTKWDHGHKASIANFSIAQDQTDRIERRFNINDDDDDNNSDEESSAE